MHLLAAKPGLVNDGSAAVDLGQSPGDIVVLSAAESELNALAAAQAELTAEFGEDVPSLRLASLNHLGHNYSVDLYCEAVIAKARLVVVRLLGGRGYWSYGADQVTAICRDAAIPLALLPGDDQPDADLAADCTLDGGAAHRLWQYCVHGGPDNARNFLKFAATTLGHDTKWHEPVPLMRAGCYWPETPGAELADIRRHWTQNQPVATILFYRALIQGANLCAVDAMIAALAERGFNPLPIFLTSLRDPVALAIAEEILGQAPCAVIINATGFSQAVPGTDTATIGAALDCPVLQVIFSGGDEESWRQETRGLGPRDIAMNVAMPEVDGRIITRAVSFKGRARRDDLCETDIVSYVPVPDRVDFVADTARRWARLRETPKAGRRIALVLANYPNRDGRIGNGVGLDTPASAVRVLAALSEAGYGVDNIPADGDELIARLLRGPTNDHRALGRQISATFSLTEYSDFFETLAQPVRDAVGERWGAPEDDPFYSEERLAFAIPAFRCGNIAVALQPARGYNIDPQTSYHDPALVPPHFYLAFYGWIRHQFGAHAVVDLGKHGNLEWLPGKAVALSDQCFPEAALGPMPHLYPFIVNDPGEGTQAKRRAQAVIVDHLTPPLTRAESYGPLRDLELLVDEYYDAAGLDPRRLKILSEQILDHAHAAGLDSDCGIDDGDGEDAALAKLDNYLCELKEMQIRDGLHIFGQSPVGTLRDDLLVALLRIPRGQDAGDASLPRALVADLGLGFDPLDAELGEPWTGPRPKILDSMSPDPWRSTGDTVERLEALATALVAGVKTAPPPWHGTRAVLATLNDHIAPAVAASGTGEIKGLLAGLDGRFVAPGPSGAPTRGRPDVLPTGRNFYSVDTRTVPTPAAWLLGWKSASLLVERHAQDHGNYPRRIALSAWGTSNMRTGGDDIAQGLALMGVRPTWDAASRRVTGFEILPLSVLDRPRVDVTLRVSGFFRDAFPALIDLFDSAARQIAALDDEDESENPLAAQYTRDRNALQLQGCAKADAERRAGYRVFGSKPGAYGAGLQALIDEKGWSSDADLAASYIAWSGYAYGKGANGDAAHDLFRARLKHTDTVVHNQDNREHDLLDSDDYYQFEGGLTAAVRTQSGTQPTVYHNDHSRPDSPKIRTLAEEVARVVRARVVNPKWIAGVMRHGYKGAAEMAATVDYLFAFAATAHAVRDHHFDAVYEAYISDDKVRGFLHHHNPAALAEIGERLLEAETRGLWRPRANIAHKTLGELAGLDQVKAQ